jgi:hypothetical protein
MTVLEFLLTMMLELICCESAALSLCRQQKYCASLLQVGWCGDEEPRAIVAVAMMKRAAKQRRKFEDLDEQTPAQVHRRNEASEGTGGSIITFSHDGYGNF